MEDFVWIKGSQFPSFALGKLKRKLTSPFITAWSAATWMSCEYLWLSSDQTTEILSAVTLWVVLGWWCGIVICKGSSVHGILQARILQWVTVPFPKGSSRPRDQALQDLLHCRQILYCLSNSRICLQCERPMFDPGIRMIPWRREWQPTLVILPGQFHGHRSLVGYSPWDHKELDTTEWLTFSLGLVKCTQVWRKGGLNLNSDCFNCQASWSITQPSIFRVL